MKELKRYRLLVMLAGSTIILSLLGFMGKNNVYAGYSLNLLKDPQLAAVFEGLKDGEAPWAVFENNHKKNEGQPDKEATPANALEESSAAAKETVAETTIPLTQAAQEEEPVSSESNAVYQDTQMFTPVDESYFNDALFIGDSRTVGLSQYSGWTNPVYYASVGLTIYDVFDKEVADVNGQKLTIDNALQKQKFGKIYIMLGINELGRGTTESFAREYSKVITRLRELQPDAIIFIEGIMNVSKKKSDSDPIFNNINIKARNDAIKELADNSTVFYIDVNEAIVDDTGGIPEDYTFDNIHLKAAYYKLWTDFLLEHGIVKKN